MPDLSRAEWRTATPTRSGKWGSSGGDPVALGTAAVAVRAVRPDGDARSRPQHVGVATQHRIFAVLREFLNHQWRREHKIPFNPVHAVQLPPEEEYEAERWTAAQTRVFLAAAASDPLGLMFRVGALCGARRAGGCGVRWAGGGPGGGGPGWGARVAACRGG